MPYLLFLKKRQNLKLSSAAYIPVGGALRVKLTDDKILLRPKFLFISSCAVKVTLLTG